MIYAHLVDHHLELPVLDLHLLELLHHLALRGERLVLQVEEVLGVPVIA